MESAGNQHAAFHYTAAFYYIACPPIAQLRRAYAELAAVQVRSPPPPLASRLPRHTSSIAPPTLFLLQAGASRRQSGLEAELAAVTAQLTRAREVAADELAAAQERAAARVRAAEASQEGAAEAARMRLEARMNEAVAAVQSDARQAARAAASRIGAWGGAVGSACGWRVHHPSLHSHTHPHPPPRRPLLLQSPSRQR